MRSSAERVSVMPANWSTSHEAPNATSRHSGTTKTRRPGPSSRWPTAMAGMDIDASPSSCAKPAGTWARIEWSGSPPHGRRPVRGDPGIWRREGLKVPQRQKPRGRLWLNDGSCVRLRPEHRNHVWSYDFMSTRTHDGRSVRVLNLIDEFTRECFMVRAERRWSSAKVIGALADVMVWKGVPEHL